MEIIIIPDWKYTEEYFTYEVFYCPDIQLFMPDHPVISFCWRAGNHRR